METKTLDCINLEKENLCCALADKKHQAGVTAKKDWLAQRIPEGHVFRKIDVQGKVFIEYAPLETAWVPIDGKNYLYIYCFWVAGSWKGKGYGQMLLDSCIEDARRMKKSGICVLSSARKKPFLSDKKYLVSHGFLVADQIGEYELLALSFDATLPAFRPNARKMHIPASEMTIYYSLQCPYIRDCICQIQEFCTERRIPVQFISVETCEQAKAVPCVFNNWAFFYQGTFVGVHLYNAGSIEKFLKEQNS
jgi:GNAT superfamily N-acetyltransferase